MLSYYIPLSIYMACPPLPPYIVIVIDIDRGGGAQPFYIVHALYLIKTIWGPYIYIDGNGLSRTADYTIDSRSRPI